MHVIADFCITPLGVGVSLSPYIAACERILEQAGLKPKLHSYGTNVEGEWDAVFVALKRCHDKVHEMGAPRVTTSIPVETRTDRVDSIVSRIDSVKAIA